MRKGDDDRFETEAFAPVCRFNGEGAVGLERGGLADHPESRAEFSVQLGRVVAREREGNGANAAPGLPEPRGGGDGKEGGHAGGDKRGDLETEEEEWHRVSECKVIETARSRAARSLSLSTYGAGNGAGVTGKLRGKVRTVVF